MVQEHKIENMDIPWEQAELKRLLDRGIQEGEIRDEQLRLCLDRAKVDPETIEQVYADLKALDVRVIEGVPEPTYTLEQKKTIWQHLEERGIELTEREEQIVRMRFEEGLDLTETAERLGLTRERVRQIECKAIRKAARPIVFSRRRKIIRDF